MAHKLTASSTLDNLKKEAKRWLKALRANDPEPRERLRRIYPKAPADPGLRDVQHALALEYGFDGWTVLKSNLETQFADAAPSAPTHGQLVARFLECACPDHHVRGPNMHAMALNAAERMLRRHPGIARDSLYTAVVCGELEEVERILRGRPELATAKSGTTAPDRSGVGDYGDLLKDIGAKGWGPLLYLCFTRLLLHRANENAVAIARLLLDRGADPNVYFQAGDSHYTPLTGVIGEGEEERPPHPHRDELTRLLLERGAEPYDSQVIYNIHFHGKILWFVKLMYEFSVKAGRKSDWDDPEWHMLDQGSYGSGARWHLDIAVKNNDRELAEWCLQHGASPNAAPARDRRFPQWSIHETALRADHQEIADLLARYGAKPYGFVREPLEEFQAACLRLDRAEAKLLLKGHPEYLQYPHAMRYAAEHDLVDAVALLLDLGMSIEIEDPKEGRQRPLHAAAYGNSLKVAELLIQRGADIDPVETKFGATPISFAVYAQNPKMIDLLGRYSKEMFPLTVTGNIKRLREVLAEWPGLAKSTREGNFTLLMWLPDDEARAMEIADLLIVHGADPTAVGPQSRTAADYASRRGMEDVAALLREKAAIFPKSI